MTKAKRLVDREIRFMTPRNCRLNFREALNIDFSGLVESKTSEFFKNSEVLRLTPRARLLANQVFMRFV